MLQSLVEMCARVLVEEALIYVKNTLSSLATITISDADIGYKTKNPVVETHCCTSWANQTATHIFQSLYLQNTEIKSCPKIIKQIKKFIPLFYEDAL